MSANPYPLTPRDKGSSPKDGYPPAEPALATTNKENTAVSSILLLTHDTTEIEVVATGVAVAGKWLTQATIDSSVAATSVITGAAGGPNFDFVVQTTVPRRFAVPQLTSSNSESVMGVNRAEGLAVGVAYKTVTAAGGSVMTMQF